jgi:glycosyltransferase involved in cell wall biosynthesis
MKVSIITINFNNLLGLKKTLESVFEQTYQNIEYIIIDGGSSDGSKELIESLSGKFSFWVSEPDSGIYNAMNKGVMKASGDYVIHMNSGDAFYSKNTLTECISSLASGEDVICGNSYFVNDSYGRAPYIWQAPKEVSFRYFCRDTLNHQSMFIKRNLFNRVGLYSEQYKVSSDWMFLMQAFAFHKATYKKINLIVSLFDRSGFSTVNWEVGLREQQKIFINHFSFFYNDGSSDDLEFFYPFLSNFKKNMKILIKMVLPHWVVRSIESYKARKRIEKISVS